MKKIFYLLLLLPIIPLHSQTTNIAEDIKDTYTEAINAKFNGDLAKSRFLLETIKEKNHTNEFIMSVLLEVYKEYLDSLIKAQDQKTLQIAYPGIRENIAEIWDMFPNSTNIQDLSLKISMLTGDKDMGKAMSMLVLKNDPMHILANYIMGLSAIIQKNYIMAKPYLKKVAHAEHSDSVIRQYIYQSRVYLGDINLEQKIYLEALEYYKKSLEYANSIDIVAKVAIFETYRLNINTAIQYFKAVPLEIMSDTMLHVYAAALWISDTAPDRYILNNLLIQQKHSSPFLQALVQAQLGRTQYALKLLQQDTIIKTEFLGLYDFIRLKLLNRLGQKEGLFEIKSSIGQFYFQIHNNEKAKEFLTDLDRTMDTNGKIATILASIAHSEWDYKTSKKLYQESLKKSKDLYTYIRLVDLENSFQNFQESEKLINELKYDSFWTPWLKISLLYEQNKLDESLTNLLELKKNAPHYDFVNQLLSIIYLKLKEYDKAEKIILQVYNQDPYNNINKNLLAYFYAVTGKNLNKALTLALDITSEKPNDIVYLDTLAWVYTQRKEYTAAKHVFTKIEELLKTLPFVPNSEEIYAHLGFYYLKTGEPQKSLEYLNKGLSIDPDDIYIQELKQQVTNNQLK